MNTHLTLTPRPLPVSWRPLGWLRAGWAALHNASSRDDGLEALVELDARTLNDIGAPERLRLHAHAHREAQQRCRDDLLAGSAGAGWRHW
jgi:hypothetical protein